jgi:protein arginine kinase activator
MLCQRCQERQASVQVIKMMGNEKTSIFLCESCAKEKGDLMNQLTTQPFDFHNLLSGLLNMESPPSGLTPAHPMPLRCESCNMSYTQFTQYGRFGCPNCYENFANRLEPLLRRIQNNTQHTGKVPRKSGEKIRRQRELERLRKEMQQVIQQEQFEQAAAIRDQIRALEQNSEG